MTSEYVYRNPNLNPEFSNKLLLKTRDHSQDMYSPPTIFDLSKTQDQIAVEDALDRGEIQEVIDPIDVIADSMFELHHPELRASDGDRSEYISGVLDRGYEFGSWVMYPWSRKLVRFPGKSTYSDLITYRYKNLISREDQDKLSDARISVSGTSIGGVIVSALVRNSVGGAICISDRARPNVPNIGRSIFNLDDLSLPKIDSVAKEASEINPFVDLYLIRGGIDKNSIANLEQFNPDIVIDEVDDMATSALIRSASRERRWNYLTASDVHNTSVLEVILHKTGKRKPLYASRFISDEVVEKLLDGNLTDKDRDGIFAKSVGFRNLTPELVGSALEIDRSVSGIPQLGSTALVAAGFMVATVREVIVGRDIRTGLYRIPVGEFIGAKPTMKDWIKLAKVYKQYMDN